MSVVNVTLIVAVFVSLTPIPAQALGICTPVFWYYHGDHLGSTGVITDRNGVRVWHYEYFAFGKEKYGNTACSFSPSNRYTGQILDDDTGLYYYNARYGACPERSRRDPEIGRFIQPDTIVPTAADPQRLNRYSYCGDNPLNNTDPSGHDPLTVAIIIVVVAVVVNVVVAAATGGDIGKAALAGFIGGVVGVVGGFIASIALSSVAATLGPVATGAIVGAVGGAAGGAASAAVSGGDIGMGALTGAVGGAIGGAASGWTANWGNTGSALAARAAVTVCSGALAGGVTAAIAGGNIWQGMAIGAAGAAVAFAATVAMSGNGDTVAEQVKSDHPQGSGSGSLSPDQLKAKFSEQFTDVSDANITLTQDLSKNTPAPPGYEVKGQQSGRQVEIDKDYFNKGPRDLVVKTIGHELGHFADAKTLFLYPLRYAWQVILGRGRMGMNYYEAKAEIYYGSGFASKVMGHYVAPQPAYTGYWKFDANGRGTWIAK